MGPTPRLTRLAPLLAPAVLALLALVALASHGTLHGGLNTGPLRERLTQTTQTTAAPPPRSPGGQGGNLHLPGWLLWAGLGVVALAAVVLLAVYLRVARPQIAGVAIAPPARGTANAVANEDEEEAQRRLREIVDRSLEELRADPNARRAIIGVYHLMERALERVGLPRAPAEAPREYLTRALDALQVGPAAPRRLTALFERARFGDGELDLGLRDDAIDALLALRGELAR
jgi:Domain of unknown function (DUF4129)